MSLVSAIPRPISNHQPHHQSTSPIEMQQPPLPPPPLPAANPKPRLRPHPQPSSAAWRPSKRHRSSQSHSRPSSDSSRNSRAFSSATKQALQELYGALCWHCDSGKPDVAHIFAVDDDTVSRATQGLRQATQTCPPANKCLVRRLQRARPAEPRVAPQSRQRHPPVRHLPSPLRPHMETRPPHRSHPPRFLPRSRNTLADTISRERRSPHRPDGRGIPRVLVPAAASWARRS